VLSDEEWEALYGNSESGRDSADAGATD